AKLLLREAAAQEELGGAAAQEQLCACWGGGAVPLRRLGICRRDNLKKHMYMSIAAKALGGQNSRRSKLAAASETPASSFW
ncbi:MAG: hypothetical protein ABJ056_04860, partial [Halioglobus sp.]